MYIYMCVCVYVRICVFQKSTISKDLEKFTSNPRLIPKYFMVHFSLSRIPFLCTEPAYSLQALFGFHLMILEAEQCKAKQ